MAPEQRILDELARFVEEIEKKHGVRIEDAAFKWLDVSSINGRAYRVESVRAAVRINP